MASIRGKFPQTKFIGEVLKLNPRIVVKYIRGIEHYNVSNASIVRYLEAKKSIIRNLFKTDNLFVSISKKELVNRESFKTKIKEGLKKTSISFLLKSNDLKKIDRDVIDYVMLQKIHHFINDEIVHLLIPLRVDERKSLIRGAILRDEEDGVSIFVDINFDGDEYKTGILLRIDLLNLVCTIYTEDYKLYGNLKKTKKYLESAIRSIKYDRKVSVEVKNDYSELNEIGKNIKRIDLKM